MSLRFRADAIVYEMAPGPGGAHLVTNTYEGEAIPRLPSGTRIAMGTAEAEDGTEEVVRFTFPDGRTYMCLRAHVILNQEVGKA